ncbi:MAG TPA: circularly permuted type 2 ATP-grasp protein, partial [Steroidobacteraceae bacterium]|nr:circularly permuted type 2 ATP-grasp protein [Steroidobacteraceae bacterium]
SLPSVATWWCGEQPALEYTCENLDKLVIKGTFPNQKTGPIFGDQLDTEEREQLIERMRQRPHVYVAQERFALSRVPAMQNTERSEWLARAVSIRVYAVATADGYKVMPGGLARIAGDTSVDVVSNQRGGSSKDIWVLPSQKRVDGASTSHAMPRITLRHQEVPSRVGENLFWLGRYQERCEHKLRLLRSTLNWRVDESLWQHGLAACERAGLEINSDDIAPAFNVDFSASIAADIQRLQWCATQVRARLSLDHWRAISELRQRVQRTPRKTAVMRESMDRAILIQSALSGYVMEDMTQDLGWRLLMMGRRLERLQLSCALLGSQLQDADLAEQGKLEWLLEVNNSQMAFRRRFMTAPRLSLVMDLLCSDAANPRAVKCQCEVIAQELIQLGEISSNAEAMALKSQMQNVFSVDMASLEGNTPAALYARQLMASRLNELLNSSLQLADEIAQRYFAHVADDVRLVQN